MILFAEYRGPDYGEGRFIKGKVYLAEGVSEGGVEYSRHMTLTDEEGERIRLDHEDARFAYSSNCLAVVIEPTSELELGSVVSCSKLSRGESPKVEVMGNFCNVSRFILLDRLSVHTGVKVLWQGEWYNIGGVGENMSVLLDGEWRELQECHFFVVEGRMGSSPAVRCLNDLGLGSISQGALYEVSGESDELYTIKGDDGKMCGFDKDRFKKILILFSKNP